MEYQTPKYTFIDFHCHILPRMDDGSSSSWESIRMLTRQAEQGIRLVVATPHFYADRDSSERFFERRAQSADALREHWDPSLPRMRLGAEVAYFRGIAQYDVIRDLCIAGTNVLLLEMPFSKWPENVLREVISLQEERNIQVLIAHIERYARYQGRGVLDTLWEHGIRFQVNAEALTNWRTVRFVRRLLEKDRLHVLGSDSHNLTTRQPNLGQALSFLEEKYGVETIKHLRDNAVQMLTPTIAYPRGNP